MHNVQCALGIAICAMVSPAMGSDVDSAGNWELATQQQGYVRVSEGFFVKQIGNQDSYMAIGKSGNQAMANLLMQQREISRQASERIGSNADSAMEIYDTIIDRLTAPQPKVSASQTGDCSGTQGSPDFYISAQASGGVLGLANARNDAGAVNTANFTWAWTVNRSGTVTAVQQSTTYGSSPSQSLVSVANNATACESHAFSSITCPGHSNPSLSLFVTELKWWDCRW